MRSIKPFAVIVALVLIVFYTSCKKSSNDQPFQEPEYVKSEVVQSNVTIIKSETATLISDSTQLEQGVYKFQFVNTPTNYKANDIIVGQTGDGYLRKVVSSIIEGDIVTLQTEQATFEDLFVNISDTMNFDLSNLKSQKLGLKAQLVDQKINYLADGISLESDNYNFSFSNTTIYKNGPLSFNITSGSLSFDPKYKFILNVNNKKIKKLGFYFDNANLTLDCNVNLNATQKTSIANFEKTIADVVKIYTVYVPGTIIPVTVVVNLKLKAKFTADIEAAFNLNTGVTNNYSLTLGGIYENGAWTGKYNLTPSLTLKPVDVSGTVQLGQSFTITPEVSLKFYGVAGPYFTPQLYEKFNIAIASPSFDWDAKLNAGINTTFGANITVFGKTLTNYSKSYDFSNDLWIAPYKINKISGDNQVMPANHLLAQPCKIKITDNLNNVLKDVVIHFAVTKGGGTISTASIMSDVAGFAQTNWTLGTAIDQELKVMVKDANGADIQGSPQFFTASTNVKSKNLSVVSGNNQKGTPNVVLPNPIVLKVLDIEGNPVINCPVYFAVSNGSIDNTTPITDANGTVSIHWTLGNSVANQSIEAYLKDENGEKIESTTISATVTANEQPNCKSNPFTDSRDGKIYYAIQIGGQTWMSPNLGYKFSGYNGFYSFSETTNVCPSGWHLPSESDWDELISYLGGEGAALSKMTSQSCSGTNESCFSGLMVPFNWTWGKLGVVDMGYCWWSSAGNVDKIGCSQVQKIPCKDFDKLPIRCIKD